MEQHARDAHESDAIVAGPQAVSAVSPHEAPATAPPVLSDTERALLTAALDRIIPAEGDLPGAGALGVAAVIERTLAISLALRRLFLDGLLQIALTSARHAPESSPNSGAFTTLPTEAQDDVLRVVERAHPAFFAALIDHTYRNYYADARVHRLIGWESRPPQPLGHHLAPFDPALLERQRARLPFWRSVSPKAEDANGGA